MIGLQTYFSGDTAMDDPMKQRWLFVVRSIPVSVGIFFDHEPTADEMEKAWGNLNLSVRKKLLE